MESKRRLAVGNKQLAVVLAKQSTRAQMTKKRMVHCATHCAEMATTVLAQFAGSTVQMNSEMTEHSVTSLNLTAEVLVRSITVITAKNGAHSGTPSAEKTSTTLHAVYAHLIVQPV